MTCRLVRQDGGLPLYFSHRAGALVGAPQGGWTPDIADATAFETLGAAQTHLDTQIPEPERPMCRIEEA